ncbi:MAG: histidinol-phosphatase [Gemmatimonadetes bacterium]|nr:histidinol-phosphatase [Gemmatimonadota bacterium]
MTREQLRDALDVAVEIAWRAGRATLAHYQTGVATEAKADDSPVTEADRAAERIARRLIAARYPADAILGEEEGETHAGADRRWILDPIDGTRTFVRGVPFYGVMIALEYEADAVLGVIHFPALGETVYAARGHGCWWNGRRALVSEQTRLNRALIVTTDIETIENEKRGAGWNALRRSVGLTRTWGDCYGYALVATGRAEAMLDPVLSLWDVAALAPIIEEAGGVITDWDGASGYRLNSAVATNAALATQLRRILKGDL